MYTNSIVGPKVFELSAKMLIDKGWLVKPLLTFYDYEPDKKAEPAKETPAEKKAEPVKEAPAAAKDD